MKNINQIMKMEKWKIEETKKSINIKITFLINLYSILYIIFYLIFIREEKGIYKNEIIIEINRHLDSS